MVAYNALGKIYKEGIYVQKDSQKSYNYFIKAQDSDSYYNIALLLKNCEVKKYNDLDQQLLMAKNYFDKASNMQHIEALFELGQIYENGLKNIENSEFLITKNLQKAEECYSIGKDNCKCVLNLGLLYLRKKQYEKCVEQFQLAAEMGNKKAYFEWAKCFDLGRGVSQSNEQFEQLIEESIKNNVSEAMIYYSIKILKTKQEAKYNKAFQLLIKNFEDSQAIYYLGIIYEVGLGKPRNFKTSFDFFNQSAELNYPPALNRLGDIYYQGAPGIPKNIIKSLQLYKEASNLQNEKAMLNLGNLYQDGYLNLVQIDYQQSIFYYEKACELQYPPAFYCLGIIYQQGKGVKQNYFKANEYFQQGVELGCQNCLQILNNKNTEVNQTYLRKEKVKIIENFDLENTDENMLVNQIVPTLKNNKNESFSFQQIPEKFQNKTEDYQSINKQMKKVEGLNSLSRIPLQDISQVYQQKRQESFITKKLEYDDV